MRHVKRLLTLAAACSLLLVAGAAAVVLWSYTETAPIIDGLRVGGVQVVRDGYVSSFLVDLQGGGVALIDAGKDPDGKAILEMLARRGIRPSAVQAILLTHGDYDHVAGARRFPKAVIMSLADEVPLVEGHRRRGLLRFLPPRPTGIRVHRKLQDGENVHLPGVTVRVFAIPGHSRGSAAFLTRGVLFMGDAANVSKEGALEAGWGWSHDDPAQNRDSLERLAERLRPLEREIKAIACAHSQVITRGFAPLADYVQRRRKER